MKLIIDINKDYYEIIKHEVEHGHDFKPYTLIANGTPLSEGHWIEHDDWDGDMYYECSVCKEPYCLIIS